jgi:arylsulfatase A-like enzyme
MSRTIGTRRLGAAAVVAALALAGCTGPDPTPGDSETGAAPAASPPPRNETDPGRAAVRDPRPSDVVLPTGDEGLAEPVPVDSPDQPNLLMITLDDAAWGDMVHMPRLQELLVDEGVTLRGALAPNPICVPARSSLMTGQHSHNHGTWNTTEEGGHGLEALDESETLAVWLQEAGYDTFFLGKYPNGYEDGTVVPPGWTGWRGLVDPTTYNFVRPKVSVDGVEQRFETYSTTLLSEQSEEMLRDPARAEDPWYMWLNYVAPHHGGPDAPDDPAVLFPDDPDPVKTTTPARRDVDTFADLDLPDTPNMFEEDVSDKVLVRPTQRTVSDDRRAQMTEAHQQRIESLQSVDRALGRTIETLEETGQLDETYVVLTSDNGYTLGAHNLEGKLWYFREMVGVPMYVRGPGLEAGTTSQAPVTNVDWAPTFAALAGARPTAEVDGVDVLPWIGSDADRRVVPIEAYPVQRGRKRLYRGVVVGPWTYVQNRAGRAEVYYREVDEWEMENIAGDPRYADQVARLKKLVRRTSSCAGEQCPSTYYR